MFGIRGKRVAGTCAGSVAGDRLITLRPAVVLDAPDPMLAQLASRLPSGAHLRYEPKLDGFRGLLEHALDGRQRLTSRNRKDLTRWFPEVARAGEYLPAATVLDGELVVADEHGQPDFGALQARLTMTPDRISDAALNCPAVLVVFDVLQLGGNNLVDCPLVERRQRLEDVVVGLHPCLQLVLQTADPNLANDWLARVPAVEGIVAKRADGRYRFGRRDWIKVKRQRTADCVVIGVAGDDHAPTLVLALRHADGNLHLFGTCRQIPTTMSEPVARLLLQAGPLEGPIPSRWQHQELPAWRRVPAELVCEVRFAHVDGRWLRQPATLLRWRPDRSPDDCGLEQLQVD
jgi:ATP-dependent DNA ligase